MRPARIKRTTNMKRLVFSAGIVLCLAASRSHSATLAFQPPGDPPMKLTYLVVYKQGPAWLAGKPMAEQPLKEHGRYMLGLYTKGSLKWAGPFTDDAGGAAVFEAGSDDEARAIVAADPSVTSGIFVADLHPWRLVDWESHVKK
jgi:uncharacterized protein